MICREKKSISSFANVHNYRGFKNQTINTTKAQIFSFNSGSFNKNNLLTF